jgi:hypothetical protein
MRLSHLVCCGLILVGSVKAADDDLLKEFTITNDLKKQTFFWEAKGLRMTTPKASLENLLVRPNHYWMTDSAFALSGDFEFAVDYDVRTLNLKGAPPIDEANAEFGVFHSGNSPYLGINVSVHHAHQQCFHVLRRENNLLGSHFNIVPFPRKSDVGRMVIRRAGSETIFLVKDGPDVPLVELVRYGSDPAKAPRLRFSSYQGNNKILAPIDVTFSKIDIKAKSILRGKELLELIKPKAATPLYPIVIDYSQDPSTIFHDFCLSNDPNNTFSMEGDSVRIKPVIRKEKDAPGYFFRDTRYAVGGDFEYSAHFELNSAGPLDPRGYRSTSFGISLETPGPMGSVNLTRRFADGIGHCFTVVRFSPTRAGPNHDHQFFATKAMSGDLLLRRVGIEVYCLIREEGKTEFTELCHFPFVSTPIDRLRMIVDQGGTARTPIDGTLSKIMVKTNQVIENERVIAVTPKKDASGNAIEGEPVILAAVPQKVSRKWQYLGIGAGVFLFALVGTLIVRKKRRVA